MNDNRPDEPELDGYRKEIDALDDRIVELLLQRVGVVEKVGRYKEKSAPGKCPIRAGREADMVRRIMKRFEGTSFPPAAAGAMWRLMIAASTSVEAPLKISVYTPDGTPGGHNDLYWLAREYFGVFNPITRLPHIKRVIGDVMDGKAAVGILPMPRRDDTDHWWTNLMQSGEKRPKVFAQIPFIHPDMMAKEAHSALAIANIAHERTGDDTSLIVMETDFNVSQNRLQTEFANAKMEASWIQIANLTPSSRHHLIEVKGYLTPEHKDMQALITKLGHNTVLNVCYLGAYATPILISKDEQKPTLHAAATAKK